MHPVLRLYEDVLSSAENVEFRLAPLPRFIFVVHGSATIDGKTLNEGDAWQGDSAAPSSSPAPAASPAGAGSWRAATKASTVACAPGMITHEKLSAYLETMPKGELLMRGDSVAFPPGGCAYLHSHQGPGIRCLIEGGIRIDTHGRSTSYGPGGAWYEIGPDPVFAQAAADRPSRFIRVMILPRALIGKSSIQYVNEDDKAKPKTQSYKIYADAPIAFEAKEVT